MYCTIDIGDEIEQTSSSSTMCMTIPKRKYLMIPPEILKGIESYSIESLEYDRTVAHR